MGIGTNRQALCPIVFDIELSRTSEQFNCVLKQGLEENIKLCDTYYPGWQVDWIIDNIA